MAGMGKGTTKLVLHETTSMLHTPDVKPQTASRQLHIFCDTSERIYGAVAYLRTEDENHTIHTSFVMARSGVAPKKQLSMPRLELSAALAGAPLSSLL